MAWVALNKEDRERVRAQLPDVLSLQERAVNTLRPDFIALSYSHDPKSNVPIAAVCLTDATSVLMQIRHALSELLSFRIWYLERKDPPNEPVADYMAQFYADDIALRLYAVVEHLDSAILAMMETDKKAVRSYQKGEIGKNTLAYLNDQHPGATLTRIWSRLMSSREWKAVRKYRNSWVHGKPPIVKGWGDQFNRKPRWKEVEVGTRQLTVRAGGDPAQWAVQKLIDTITKTVFQVVQATDSIVDYYSGKIEPFRRQSFLSVEVMNQSDI